jgi:hypothetical protein
MFVVGSDVPLFVGCCVHVSVRGSPGVCCAPAYCCAGTVKRGVISPNTSLLLGPDIGDGSFKTAAIKSIVGATWLRLWSICKNSQHTMFASSTRSPFPLAHTSRATILVLHCAVTQRHISR